MIPIVIEDYNLKFSLHIFIHFDAQTVLCLARGHPFELALVFSFMASSFTEKSFIFQHKRGEQYLESKIWEGKLHLKLA
jgi:hypothetical protein